MNSRVIDIIGKRYGNLVVIGYSGTRNKRGVMLWNCLCDCGKECLRDKTHFNSGVKSCGCLNKNRNLGGYPWSGHGKISGSYWWSVQNGAKSRNIQFDITIEHAWEIFEKQGGQCALSGLEIFLSQNPKKKKQTASIDRIDSTKGYIEGNIQWVHKKVNLCKNTQNNQEFLVLCRAIKEYNERR